MLAVAAICVLGLADPLLVGSVTFSHGSDPPSPVPRWIAAGAGSLAVTIDTPSREVDPGVPFTLSSSIAGGLPPFEFLWGCPLVGANESPTWTVALPAGATASFTLEVADATSEVGSANLTVTVGAAPRVGGTILGAEGDVHVPLPLNLSVSGGVAPYQIFWNTTGNGTRGTISMDAPGWTLLPVLAALPGPQWVQAEVVDAVGGEAATSLALPFLYPWPNLTAAVDPSVGEVGHPFSVRAVVLGGAPPVTWTVDPLGPVRNASPESGRVPSSSALLWNATFDADGNLTVLLDAVDAVGESANASLVVPVIPAVAALLAVATGAPENGSPLALSAALSGGRPPYAYRFELSDGEGAGGTAAEPGPVNWTAVPSRAGYLGVSLTVTDALGYTTRATLTIFLAPPGGGGTSGGPSGGASVDPGSLALPVVGLGLGGLVLAYAAWRRRRLPAQAAPPVDRALGVLARLLATPEGLDRTTLESLAEEQGIGPDLLNATVDRAVRTGRLRIEDGLDGERLHWIPAVSESGGPTSPRADGKGEADG